MSGAGYFSLAWVAMLLGCVCLALSQSRHWRAAGGAEPRPRFLKPAGLVASGCGLLVCVAGDGGSFAALLWPLLFAAAALLTALLLTYRVYWLGPVVRLLRRRA